MQRADGLGVTEEVRVPRIAEVCEGVAVAAPSGHVLFRSRGSLSPAVWERLIPCRTGRLIPLLSTLVRAQWARRPEADAIFVKVGEQILLARAQAQAAERPQVVITLLDMTRASRDDDDATVLAEDELATERRRLARELHDLVGQRLATLLVNLDCDLREEHVDIQRTRAYRDELRAILVSARNVHQDLRWTANEAGGLVGAIRRQVVPALQRARCQVRFVSRQWPSAFPADDSVHVLRTVQESTANVIRHAQATRTVVRLEGDKDSALVSVTDNGIGFHETGRLGSTSATGLAGMRERANLMGGHLRVFSTPGLGTTVSLVVPRHG